MNSNEYQLLKNKNCKENLNKENDLMNDENYDVNFTNDLLKHNSNSLDSIISEQINEQNNISEIIFIIIKSAIPISLEALFVYLIETLNILFIGNYMEINWMSAYSLASFLKVCFGTNLIIAFTGSIDTLSSNAYGAKKFKNVGINMTIGFIVNLIGVLVIYLPIAFNSKAFYNLILENSLNDVIANLDNNKSMNLTIEDYNYTSEGRYVKIKNDNNFNDIYGINDLSEKAFYIVKISSLSLLIKTLTTVLSKTLIAMKIFKFNMIISFVCLVLHPLWLYIFVVILKLEFNGILISSIITDVLSLFMFLYIYTYSNSINNETLPYFNLKDMKANFLIYLKFSIFSFFIIF